MYQFEINTRKSEPFFRLEYPSEYIENRDKIIEKTRIKRSTYKEILNNHLQDVRGYGLLQSHNISSLSRINFLLSGSRGGSSITVEILKQQAQSAKGSGKKILSLPGEQKPYLELARLTPPFKNFLSDKLDENFVGGERSEYLLFELVSEIGYPISQTTDLRGFAISTYGRLLLQWPNINFGNPDLAIEKIEDAIKQICHKIDDKLTYVDEATSREKLIYLLKSDFPKLDLKFYDEINSKVNISTQVNIEQYESFIEEPPFILPTPWHFASIEDLSSGVLLLKDPSDAWRISFWQKLFNKIPISYTHLTRGAHESINGLCDGWKFPYGYITTRSSQPLHVRGYTNIESPWTNWYVNYSTSDKVWEILLSDQVTDLEQIVAQQWIDAHQAIISKVGNDINYHRLVNKENGNVGFEWLRSNPIEAIKELCSIHGFELTSTLLQAATKMSTRHVQVTPGINNESDRWKKAPNHNKIALYAKNTVIIALSKKLGYTTN